MEHAQLFLLLASLFGFFMAWGIGANDVANAMGTSVGSGALTITQAIFVAAIFESAGAILVGGQVTDTIRGDIIDLSLLAGTPELLVYGMLSALLASGVWLLVASSFGWPVSTTHSIVGAIIGFGWVELGANAVNWSEVTDIVLSWVVTPIIAGFLGYLLFVSEIRLIFYSEDPVRNAKRYVPFYIFLAVFAVAVVTFTKGLVHLHWELSLAKSVLFSVAISLFAMIYGIIALRQMPFAKHADREQVHDEVEKVFSMLMIFTACAMAFAHGSNDIANAIGPLAAIVGVVHSGGDIMAQAPVPIWILIFGAIGLVTGLAMYGHKVIGTIGTHITELTPSRGFAASLATATTVVIASGTGLPISTTQTLVGAILGVGFARGLHALNLGVIRGIFMSWVITLPSGAILCILFFTLFKAIFS